MEVHPGLWGTNIIFTSQPKHTNMLGHTSQKYCSHFSTKTQWKNKGHFSFFFLFQIHLSIYCTLDIVHCLTKSDKLTHHVSGFISTSTFRWLVITLTDLLFLLLNNIGEGCNWTWDLYTLRQDTNHIKVDNVQHETVWGNSSITNVYHTSYKTFWKNRALLRLLIRTWHTVSFIANHYRIYY